MNKNKLERLKVLSSQLKNLQSALPISEAQRLFDQIVSEETQKFSDQLKSNPTVKYLGEINNKLTKFKEDFNIASLVDVVNSVQEQLTELQDATDQKLAERLNAFNDVIKKIQKDGNSSQKTTEGRINEFVDQIEELRKTFTEGNKLPTVLDKALVSFNDRFDGLNSRFQELDKDVVRQIGSASKTSVGLLNKQLETALDLFRSEMLSRIANVGGGNANRNIWLKGNSSVLSRYTDINIKQGSNMTITAATNDTTKTTDITFASSGGGGGGGYQSATGTVDGSNKIFDFSTEPNAIVVDGISMQKVQSDTTVNWTGTTTITLTVAPNFDIYAVG